MQAVIVKRFIHYVCIGRSVHIIYILTIVYIMYMTIQFNDPKHELPINVVMVVIHYDTT